MAAYPVAPAVDCQDVVDRPEFRSIGTLDAIRPAVHAPRTASRLRSRPSRVAWSILLGLATFASPALLHHGSRAARTREPCFAVPPQGHVGPRWQLGGARAQGRLTPPHQLTAVQGVRPVPEARPLSKGRAASAVIAVLDGQPAIIQGNPTILNNTIRILAGTLLAIAVFIVLLYTTSAFESAMEVAAGCVTGKSPVAAGVIGLAVGALHTVAGPDHLAGLAPLVIGQKRSPIAAFGMGALWGSGHATGQLLLGIGCLAVQLGILRVSLVGEAFAHVSTLLVGGSLIAIGILGLQETWKFKEGGMVKEEHGAARKARFGKTTYFTGVLHGLSLDAILFITPALALPRIAAGLHVAGVALGTLLSMGVYTALLSRLCSRGPRLQLISGSASAVAMLLGACILAAACGAVIDLPGL